MSDLCAVLALRPPNRATAQECFLRWAEVDWTRGYQNSAMAGRMSASDHTDIRRDSVAARGHHPDFVVTYVCQRACGSHAGPHQRASARRGPSGVQTDGSGYSRSRASPAPLPRLPLTLPSKLRARPATWKLVQEARVIATSRRGALRASCSTQRVAGDGRSHIPGIVPSVQFAHQAIGGIRCSGRAHDPEDWVPS